MTTLLNDLRYNIRMILKTPWVTLAVIVTLGLGIGANSVIFSAVNAVLIRPLPYPDANRLLVIQNAPLDYQSTNSNELINWKDRIHSVGSISAFSDSAASVNLVDSQGAVRAAVCAVTSDFFDALQVSPALGRNIQPADMAPGSNHVAVLSNQFWKSRYNSQPNIVGDSLSLNGRQFTVIGVAAPGVELPRQTEMWIPLALGEDSAGGLSAMSVVGRLNQTANIESTRNEMKVIENEANARLGGNGISILITVTTLREFFTGKTRSALLIVFGAVFFVLMIACVNVVSLLLARAASRQKEVAIRIALGAGRGRLIAQFLGESVLLGIAGGTLGLVLTLWGINALNKLGLPNALKDVSIKVDVWVLVFCAALSLLCGILAGLLPAFRASTAGPMAVLKESGDSVRSSSHNIAYRVPAGFEIAMALILLTGSGLLIRSFQRVSAEDVGFNTTNTLTLALQLPSVSYPSNDKRTQFFQEAFQKIRALPGVEDVSATTSIPFASQIIEGAPYTIGGTPQAKGVPGGFAAVSALTPGYLKTMGIRLLKGRDIQSTDGPNGQRVAIIDETLAKQAFGDRDPIGSEISLSSGKPRTIVGVVGSSKLLREEESYQMIYLPALQGGTFLNHIVIKYAGDTNSLIGSVRSQISSIDPEVPLYDVKTMDQWLSDSLADRRFTLTLLSVFAFIALALTSLGVFGVFSYSATERTREIGIRMALGARATEVTAMVLKQGMLTIACGVTVGIGGALALTRLMKGLLYSVSATDPLTLCGAALLLIVFSLAGCYLPARKSARLDPLVALRYE